MGRTLQIDTPRVFLPLLQPARYKGAWGGRGSAKSWFFADLLIERHLLNPNARSVCVREVQRSLDQSVKRLLEDSIERFGVGGQFRVLNTHIETGKDGLILFQGMQNHTAESIKSLEGYSVAWVEEAQSLSQRSLDMLRPTIRADGSELWFSWNPRFATDPIDRFLRGPDLPPGAVVVRSRYADNPYLPETLKLEMEWDRRHDPEKYAHIWLGDYERHSEARVFRNWRVGDASEFTGPVDQTYYLGADWGFATDPTVMARCYLVGRTLYLDREVYAVGCEIDQTPALFDTLEKGFARNWTVIADSARPETISYMQRHGYPRMRPARKGAGSVEEGVKFLQSCDIVVHPSCKHLIDELTLYSYKTDKLTGNILPVLEDKKNHCIDALRYALEGVRTFKESVVTIKASQDDRWRSSYFSR